MIIGIEMIEATPYFIPNSGRQTISNWNTTGGIYNGTKLYYSFDESFQNKTYTSYQVMTDISTASMTYFSSASPTELYNEGNWYCVDVYVYAYIVKTGIRYYSSTPYEVSDCDGTYYVDPEYYYWNFNWNEVMVNGEFATGYLLYLNGDDYNARGAWYGDPWYLDTGSLTANYGDGEGSWTEAEPSGLDLNSFPVFSSYTKIPDLSWNSNDALGTQGTNGIKQRTGVYGKDLSLEANYPMVITPLTQSFNTVSFWMKDNFTGTCTGSSYQSGVIWSQRTADTNGVALRRSSCNNYTELRAGSGTYNLQSIVFDNKWKHIVVTKNSTRAMVYLNGVLINTTFGIWTTIGNLSIGGDTDWNSGNRYYKGEIDDFMVLNSTLTASQVLDIYNNQSSRFIAVNTTQTMTAIFPTNTNDNRVNISVPEIGTLLGSNLSMSVGYCYKSLCYNESDPNLIGYWHADVDGNDSSGYGFNGTLYNVSIGQGKVGGGFDFSKVGSTRWVNITFDERQNLGNNFTINLWARFNDLSVSNTLITKPLSNAPWGFPYQSVMMREDAPNMLEFTISSGGAYDTSAFTPTTTLKENVWYMFSLTYDKKFTRAWVNGVQIGAHALTYNISWTKHPWIIGADYGASPVYDMMRGSIDEVMLFNRTLNQSELSYIYNTSRVNFLYTGQEYQGAVATGNNYTFQNIAYPNNSFMLQPILKFTAGTNNFYSPYISNYKNWTAEGYYVNGCICTGTSNCYILGTDKCIFTSLINMNRNNFTTIGNEYTKGLRFIRNYSNMWLYTKERWY
jgi:hypothetical protein